MDLQVLTPVNEVSLIGTPHTDVTSIMCYDLPASIMKDGKAVVGGKDINANDAAFMAKLFPKKGKAVKKVVGGRKKTAAKKGAGTRTGSRAGTGGKGSAMRQGRRSVGGRVPSGR